MPLVLELSPPDQEVVSPLRETREAIIVYNPTSGRRRDRRLRDLVQASRILKQSGIHAELVPTTHAGSGAEIARQAVRDGCELIITCGGDGTVNEVVNGIAGTQVPLALLPGGTANILAKELRIPWNIPAAARMISGGNIARVALGQLVWTGSNESSVAETSSRFFLCVAGAGPDGAIVCGVDPRVKLRAGILAYWLEGLRQFFAYQFPKFQIASADRTFAATLLIVGRTKHYGGPFRITTGASLFTDTFEIVTYSRRSRMGLLTCLPAIWFGYLPRIPGIDVWKTTRLTCVPDGSGPVYAQLDGEPAGALPIEFRIVPNALSLVLPSGVKPRN